MPRCQYVARNGQRSACIDIQPGNHVAIRNVDIAVALKIARGYSRVRSDGERYASTIQILNVPHSICCRAESPIPRSTDGTDNAGILTVGRKDGYPILTVVRLVLNKP